MANNKNLKSWHDPRIAAEMGSKGGKASGVTRRKNSEIRKCLKMIRDMDMPPDKIKEMGFNEDVTFGMAMAFKMMEASLNGNPQMARLVVELLGESKTEININGALPVVIHDDID